MKRWQMDRLTRLRGYGWNKPLTRSKRPQVVYARVFGNACAPGPPREIYSDADERRTGWRYSASWYAMVTVTTAVAIAAALLMIDTDHDSGRW